MAGALAATAPKRERYIRLADGSWKDTVTGVVTKGDPRSLPTPPSGGLADVPRTVAGAAYRGISDFAGQVGHAYDAAGMPSLSLPRPSLPAAPGFDAPPPDTVEGQAAGQGGPDVLGGALSAAAASPMGQVGVMGFDHVVKPVAGAFAAMGHDMAGGGDVTTRESGAVPAPAVPLAAGGGTLPPPDTGEAQSIAAPRAALPPIPSSGPADSTSPIPMNLPSAGRRAVPREAAAMQQQAGDQPGVLYGNDAGGAADILQGAAAGKRLGTGVRGALDKIGAPSNPPIPVPKPINGGALSRDPIDTSLAGYHDFGYGHGAKPVGDISGALAPIDVSGDIQKMGGGALDKVPMKDRYTDMQDDPRHPWRRPLFEAGLATMAAAGRPGATALGAVGEGGLNALQAQDTRDERTSRDAERKSLQETDIWKFLTGQNNENDRAAAGLEERKAYHADENNHWTDTNTRETARDAQLAAQNKSQNDLELGKLDASTAAEAARESDNAALRRIEGRNADTNEKRLNSDTVNKASDDYTNYRKALYAQGRGATDQFGALIPGSQSENEKLSPDEIDYRAASSYQNAPQSKEWATRFVRGLDTKVKSRKALTPDEKTKYNTAQGILRGNRK